MSIANYKIPSPVHPAVVALVGNADATPTFTSLQWAHFVMTPTAGRAFTLPEVAANTGTFNAGESFTFTVSSLAAFAVTVTASDSFTLVSQAAGTYALNNTSRTFRAVITTKFVPANPATGAAAIPGVAVLYPI